MFYAVILACGLGLDQTPGNCKAFASASFFPTEEACVRDVATTAAPYIESIGGEVIEAKCYKTEVFNEEV